MSEATLIDILNSVQDGESPDYDDLRYALRVMESLSTFRDMDLRRAINRPNQYPAYVLYERAFEREKTALNRPPKQWLGPNNDIDDPEVQQRQQTAQKIMDSVIDE